MAKKWIKAAVEKDDKTPESKDGGDNKKMLPKMDHKKTMKKMYRGEK